MRTLALLLLLSVPVSAASASEWKYRWFDMVSRATALIETSRHMEDRLANQGLKLRAETIAARVRVEMALDDAEDAYQRRNEQEMADTFPRAEAYIERLARALQ